MTELTMSLKIQRVGDKEAMDSLNLLDKRGRQIVDDAAGAMGKAMGAVASAYTRGSAQVKAQIEQVALAHRQTIAEMEKQGSAADSLARRQSMAALTAVRSVEQLARSAKVTGSALDTVLAQGSQLAFGFGPAGPIVGAISVATIAVVELFRHARDEAKKLADDVAKQFERIDAMNVAQQGERAAELYNGNPFAADPLDRFGVKGLRAERDRLEAVARAGTSTFYGAHAIGTTQMTDEAKRATEQLEGVRKKLAEIEPLWQGVFGVQGRGGSLERAGKRDALADLPGFITDQLSAAEKAGKEAARRYKKAWDEEVRAFAKGVDERGNAIQTRAQQIAAQMIETNEGLMAGFGIPTKEQIKAAVHEAAQNVIEAIANDPFLKMAKAVKDLAKRMKEEISQTLGDAIGAGFEEAFNASGFQNPFAAFAAVVLSGLGSFMIQLGSQMILIGVALDGLASALLSLNGPGAIAAGVLLVAAGAGLKAVASSFGRTSPSSSGAPAGTGAAPGSFLSFGVSASGSPPPTTATPAPQSRASFGPNYFIGPDDPKVQRQFADIVNRADGRGLIRRPA